MTLLIYFDAGVMPNVHPHASHDRTAEQRAKIRASKKRIYDRKPPLQPVSSRVVPPSGHGGSLEMTLLIYFDAGVMPNVHPHASHDRTAEQRAKIRASKKRIYDRKPPLQPVSSRVVPPAA